MTRSFKQGFRKASYLAGLGILGLAFTGCVSQDQYKAVKLDRDQLAERLAQADSERNSAKAESDLLKKELDQLQGGGTTKEAMLANLTTQNVELQKQLDEINRKYTAALQGQNSLGAGPLPQQVTNALNEFAQANSDIVDFNAHTGAVKFRSDVTFASGDATLTSRAKEVISRFSQILNSSQCSGFELIVAGHTDNARVSSTATLAKGHKDNWYLSAHRAISVSEALQSDGVGPQRIGATGYAEFRPVADNSSDTGRAANRRVEVLILPNTVRSSVARADMAPSAGSPSRVTRTPAKAAVPFNKDSVEAPTKPLFNK
jgi:chemotaxis protein MotB